MTFTVGNYAEKNGFKSRIRVYLTSQTVETVDSNSSSESENSFGSTTSFNNSERRINVVPDEPSLSDDDQAVGTSTSFLGTKAERDALLKEQDQVYFESLAKDQEKEKEKKLLLEKELNDVERQTSLRDIRESRLPQDITEDHVLVSVRHIRSYNPFLLSRIKHHAIVRPGRIITIGSRVFQAGIANLRKGVVARTHC